MFHNQRVVVVMPAYNAARTLEKTVREIPMDLVDDVVVTDDASSDDTVAEAKRLGLRTLVHEKNRGYGGEQKTCYQSKDAYPLPSPYPWTHHDEPSWIAFSYRCEHPETCRGGRYNPLIF